MKLLSKTNLYYVLYTALLLVCCGSVFYSIINDIIEKEVQKVLNYELAEFIENADKDSSWLSFSKPIEFEIVPSKLIITEPLVKDTLIYEHEKGEYIPYLEMKLSHSFYGKNYEVVLRESLIATDGILVGVTESMIILFICLLIGLFAINNYLSRTLWQPFYSNISAIKNYNISKRANIPHIESDINEFSELNNTLHHMSERIHHDFMSLKQFTENASHEIQTPLAIIKSKIDYLLSHVNDEETLKDLQHIELATTRISKTNQALLLLTKIENYHFDKLESLNIGKLVYATVADFKEFAEAKGLSITIEDKFGTSEGLFNRDLVQIMINNLLSNAIKHNTANGFIKIYVDNNKLIVENSGLDIKVTPEKLFERFFKINQSSESTGLGLSIIHQIIKVLQYKIAYTQQNKVHKIEVWFNRT